MRRGPRFRPIPTAAQLNEEYIREVETALYSFAEMHMNQPQMPGAFEDRQFRLLELLQDPSLSQRRLRSIRRALRFFLNYWSDFAVTQRQNIMIGYLTEVINGASPQPPALSQAMLNPILAQHEIPLGLRILTEIRYVWPERQIVYLDLSSVGSLQEMQTVLVSQGPVVRPAGHFFHFYESVLEEHGLTPERETLDPLWDQARFRSLRRDRRPLSVVTWKRNRRFFLLLFACFGRSENYYEAFDPVNLDGVRARMNALNCFNFFSLRDGEPRQWENWINEYTLPMECNVCTSDQVQED